MYLFLEVPGFILDPGRFKCSVAACGHWLLYWTAHLWRNIEETRFCWWSRSWEREREASRLVLHWHPGTMQLGAVVRIGRSVLWTEWTSFSLSPVLSRTRGFSVVLYVAFCFQGTVSFKVIESIGLSWFLISIPSVSLRIVAGCVVSKLPVWLLFSPNLCRGLIRDRKSVV